MQVSEAMTREVTLISPDQTICEAARVMGECDVGSLPVADNERLVGVITDRDIAIRGVAENLSPETPVREVMSKEVLYCFDDEPIEDVAQNMGEQQIRRLPVVDRQKRLVGIISIGDLSHAAKPDTTGEALSQISEPGGDHSQSIH